VAVAAVRRVRVRVRRRWQKSYGHGGFGDGRATRGGVWLSLRADELLTLHLTS
jgi:hypothetical protein